MVFKRLQMLLHYVLFSFKYNLLNFIFLLISFASLVFGAIRLSSATHLTVFILGAIFLAAQIIKLTYDVLITKNLELESNPQLAGSIANILPSPEEQNDGFFVAKKDNFPHIAYSKSLNRLLRLNKLDVACIRNSDSVKLVTSHIASHKESLFPILKHKLFTSLNHGSYFFNESKIGLSSTLVGSSKAVSIFKTDYFSSFLTNDLFDKYVVKSNPTGRPTVFYSNAKEALTSNPCRLKAIGNYPFNNHIGVSTVAISRDYHLCLWRQNDKSAQSAKMLAPTGSGSLNWSDSFGTGTLKDLVEKGIYREFHEESTRHKYSTQYIDIKRVLLLGYFRNISRGGKPEFLSLSLLDVNKDELYPDVKEVEDPSFIGIEASYPAKNINELKTAVDTLISMKIGVNGLSIPLWANILVLKDAMDEDEKMISAFLYK